MSHLYDRSNNIYFIKSFKIQYMLKFCHITICSIKRWFFSFSFLCGLKCMDLNKPILLVQQYRISSVCPWRILKFRFQGSVSWIAVYLWLPFLPKPWTWECGAGGGLVQSCMNFYSASAKQCFNYGLSVSTAPAHFTIRKKNLSFLPCFTVIL